MGPQEIADRAGRLGLKRKALAELSGLDINTVGMALNGGSDCRHSTVEKLQTALEGAERDQVRRLAALHPQAAIEAATVAMCPDRTSQRIGS